MKMTLQPADLAAIYEEQGWTWASTKGVPDGEAISAQIRTLRALVGPGTDAVEVSTGRLMVNYSEADREYDVYLHIGREYV